MYNDSFNKDLDDMLGGNEEKDVGGGDKSIPIDVSTAERISLVLSYVKSIEDYRNILAFVTRFQESKLLSALPKLLDESEKYWEASREHASLTDEEKDKLLHDSLIDRIPIYKMIRMRLWNTGLRMLNLGSVPEDFAAKIIEAGAQEGEYDISQDYVATVKAKRLTALSGAIDKVLAAFPSYESTSNSMVKKLEKIAELTTDVLGSNIKGKFTSFKAPSDAGLMATHLNEGKEWLGKSVSNLVDSVFRKKYTVAFKVEDHNSNCRVAEDSYIVYSDDELSALNLDCNPAVFPVMSEDGKEWQWRGVLAGINQDVKVALRDSKEKDRNKLKECLLRERAIQLMNGKHRTLEYSDDDLVTLRIVQEESSCEIIRFAKLGRSTKKEVFDNPGVVHIVSQNVASEFVQGYYPVLLGDFASVILFPDAVWAKSAHAQSGRKGQPYSSLYGTFRVNMEYHPKVSWLIAIYQLNQILEMLRCLESGLPFDVRGIADKFATLEKIYPNDTKLRLLCGGIESKKFTQMMKYVIMVVSARLPELWISPEYSKFGLRQIMSSRNDLVAGDMIAAVLESFPFSSFPKGDDDL